MHPKFYLEAVAKRGQRDAVAAQVFLRLEQAEDESSAELGSFICSPENDPSV